MEFIYQCQIQQFIMAEAEVQEANMAVVELQEQAGQVAGEMEVVIHLMLPMQLLILAAEVAVVDKHQLMAQEATEAQA